MFNPSSSITGAGANGLTTPGYNLTADMPPASNGKQWFVSGLTGTQTGVSVNSATRPFTLSVFKPLVIKLAKNLNSLGILVNNGKNTYTVITRKGVTPLAGQASELMIIRTEISVPAGADVNDPLSVRAALSLHIGALSANSTGLSDTLTDGTI